MIVQALLVGVTVCLLDFLDVWLCNPMITRPLVVGTAMGIALGDITTGVQVCLLYTSVTNTPNQVVPQMNDTASVLKSEDF